MKRSWFPILLIFGLLGLLVLLATLQYQWLGQISDGDGERLKARLESDTKRFAEDFNREIQSAYFNFQVSSDVWREKKWTEFNDRYDFWRTKTPYPNLIKNFYFIEKASQNVSRYNFEKRAFETSDWTENLNKLKPKFDAENSLSPIDAEIPAFVMTIYEAKETFDRILLRTANTEEIKGVSPDHEKKYAFLVIELDAKVITDEILPALTKTYFSQSESANYNLAVVNQANQIVFQTQNLSATDATAKLFNLSPDNFMFYGNQEIFPKVEGNKKSVIFRTTTQKIETNTTEKSTNTDSDAKIELKVSSDKMPETKPRIQIFEANNADNNSGWTLNVQNTNGSLDNFIANARRKNLAISFGILSLLGGSVLLIFLSSQRAKLFAQRQIDFVSSVSHEFRTPLAVIYSAGENLTDGVVSSPLQVEKYGNLIKGEGKKLSAMVEQILEFAGANSGRKKYDLRETNVEEVIENALGECRLLLHEQDFSLEKIIAENLPKVSVDKNALSHALQNLIVNAVKYGNGEKWLKISAENGNGVVKIAVQDKGIGIAPKDLKHIFEPFFRAKKVIDEQIHGNGLGLSLVKQTVEAHGGKITVESEIGKGSCFTIELKVKR